MRTLRSFAFGRSTQSCFDRGARYGGGFAQHIYLHANRIASVWGNDREVLTTDGDESVGNFAAGRAQDMSKDGTNITLDCNAKPGSGNARGGLVAIIAGGAAGQLRRIVGSYTGTWSVNGATPACHRSFVLNKPFDVQPDASSVFQAMPYTGGSILHRMHYADTGAVQTYGSMVQTVFSQVVGERMGGLIGWGQWRACATESQKGMCVHWSGPDPETKAIDDNVNAQNEYVSNIILDGLRADHQGSQPGTPGGTGANLAGHGDSCDRPPCAFAQLVPLNDAWRRPHIGAHNFGMMNPGRIWKQTQQFGDNGALVHRLIVWRSNQADANGGFSIGGGVAMTYENNHAAATPANMLPGESSAYVVNRSMTVALFMRGNTESGE